MRIQGSAACKQSNTHVQSDRFAKRAWILDWCHIDHFLSGQVYGFHGTEFLDAKEIFPRPIGDASGAVLQCRENEDCSARLFVSPPLSVDGGGHAGVRDLQYVDGGGFSGGGETSH